MPKLPNFLIIGAGKSGTTSIYEYLSQHPEVFMSPVKETNFFALEGKEVKARDNSPEQTEHYPWAINNFTDYQGLFEEAGNAKAIGEASPMYLYNKDAPVRIKERLPRVKLIAILRQPVDRLYSRYMHLMREGREPGKQFADALDEQSIWWRRNDLVKEGFYGTYLKRYYGLFNNDQIKVLLYDELKSNPEKVMLELYEYIGVEPTFKPDFSTEFNKSGRIKNRFVNQLIGQNSIVTKTLQSTSPTLLKYIKGQRHLKAIITKWRNKNLQKGTLSPVLKQEMTQSIYHEEIGLLETLMQRDLSQWLT